MIDRTQTDQLLYQNTRFSQASNYDNLEKTMITQNHLE